MVTKENLSLLCIDNMVYWVIYDISKNKNRKRVSDICKDYGLERVQKSAFWGTISKNKAEMLAIQAKRFLEPKTDKLLIVPADKEDFSKKISMGNVDESIFENKEVIFVE